MSINKVQWESYKKQFPNDKKIQEITFKELLEKTDGGKVNWENPPMEKEKGLAVQAAVGISECQMAIGFVIIDVICLALNGVALRSAVSSRTVGAVAKAAGSVAPPITESAKMIAAPGSSKEVIAKEVFNILKTIVGGGCLGAVLSAFFKNLKWYHALLYGAIAMATIMAAVVTDGVSFVAQVVLLLASAGFLVVDCVNAVNVCHACSVYPNVPVRIKSQWKGTYINIETGKIQATDVKPGWLSAQWIFEPVTGKDNTYRIKNVWKSSYLHIENGKLECGNIQLGWLSAQWQIQNLDGNLRIRNVWKDNIYINNEQAPEVKATQIPDVWESAKWIVQKL